MQISGARTLSDFINVHLGETAWIFGKGPSLDSFDIDSAGPLRCALSDVVEYVPRCSYCFANDSIAPWHDLYAPCHILFQPLRTIREITMQAPEPACERIIFEDSGRDLRNHPSPAALAEGPLDSRYGRTICSALQILHIMGVARVIAIGCEGYGGRSPRPWRTGMRSDHVQDYAAIHREMLSTATALGLDLRILGAPDLPPFDSLTHMKIRFLRNVAIKGQHCESGTTEEVENETAVMLIRAGDAEVWRDAIAPGAIASPVTSSAAAEVTRDGSGGIESTALEPRTETAEIAPKPTRRKRA